MAKCENCGSEAVLVKCRISDDFGTRYRDLCDDCIESFSEEAQVDILESLETAEQKSERLARIERVMLTTTPSFDGYRITDYKGIIYDETITGVGIKTAFKSLGDMFASLTGEQMRAVTNRIGELKAELIDRLKAKADKMDANAIVGIDFENTLPGGSAIMVTAHGTAVRIEKIEP